MTIHPTAVVYPCAMIEEGAYIGPFCIVGAPPQHRQSEGAGHGVVIKAGARLEKYVSVDSGYQELTVVGKNVMLMHGVHVAHDCQIGDNVVIATGAALGGHVKIMVGAFIGMNAAIHQFNVIGHYTMVAMCAMIPKDAKVWPGTTWIGNPARQAGKNTIGLERAGITEEQLILFEKEYKAQCPG